MVNINSSSVKLWSVHSTYYINNEKEISDRFEKEKNGRTNVINLDLTEI